MERHYQVAILGAGPGGYVAAIRAAQLGFKTVCIDKRSSLGGTCLNVGCIPSKSLLQSTELYAQFQHEAKEQGVSYTDLSIDFQYLMQRKNRVVKGLVEGIAASFKSHQVDFIQGTACFVDPHSVEITHENQTQRVTADYFIIATGSDSIALPTLPFDEKQVISSTGALSLSKIPKRMIVVGAGVIGVELASVYNRLGTQVTIIEILDHICPAMDVTIHKMLLSVLKKQGIEFCLSSQVVSAVVQPDEVIVTVKEEDKLTNRSADVLLVSVGRRPYTKELNVDKAGIQLTQKGFIPVNSLFQTTQSHIFAIGDVIEGVMLAHRASEEGIVVVNRIAGQPASINYMAIPNVIYTSPEAASVGLTEKEALDMQLGIQVGMAYFKGNPRARCAGQTEGLVKIIGEVQSGRLIGLHILGAHASEMIAEGMIAIEKKGTLEDIANATHAHPTLSEAIKDAALNALGRGLY